jgi:hypothetical protein
MANPFPFSSGDVLTAANLNAIGDWQTFTPTFSNVTLGGSGDVIGRYAEVNDLVFYNAKFDLGGTGSVTGAVQLDTPFGSADNATTYPATHQGWVRPTGSTIWHCMGFSSGTKIYYYAYGLSGSWSGASSVNATIPATWNSNGIGYFAGWYAKS